MSNREKLIELIGGTHYGLSHQATIGENFQLGFIAKIADHLLANGVTVPKRGRWITHSSGHGSNATNWAECSECRVCGSPQWKVCPVCETKMDVIKPNDFDPDDFLEELEDEND